MTGKIQKYVDATLFDLTRLVDAADRLYGSVAEFPDDPACWMEHMDALDSALESIPGTGMSEFWQFIIGLFLAPIVLGAGFVIAVFFIKWLVRILA